MEFKSQICTDINQSRKLLELGLKKKTADMYYPMEKEGGELPKIADSFFGPVGNSLPAWSLHRLIETIDYPSNIDAIKELLAAKTMFNNRLYDRVIDIIEYLIQKDEFNKDYMEE